MAKEYEERVHEARIVIRRAKQVIDRKQRIIWELTERIKQWEIEIADMRSRYRKALHA